MLFNIWKITIELLIYSKSLVKIIYFSLGHFLFRKKYFINFFLIYPRLLHSPLLLECLLISLSMFILNIIVVLLLANCLTISVKFTFSSHFWKTLPCWYAKHMIFFNFFFFFVICSNSRIIFSASSLFSTLWPLFWSSLFSCHSPLTIDSKNYFIISAFGFLALMFVSKMFLSFWN